jgi:5-methylcytosine-specific restriction endonuclease McrA
MSRTLLLNADYTPLYFINEFAAIKLFYKGKAHVVEDASGTPSEWCEEFRSPTAGIKIPATLRLYKQVKRNWTLPRFRKSVLFNRDEWKCQYCSKHLSWDEITIDHVLPSSRGGRTSWLNCVVACTPCNKKKANKTPDEAGMRLLKQPAVPTPLHCWDHTRGRSQWHESWEMFVPHK